MGFRIINTGSAATMAAGVGAYIAPIAHSTIIQQKMFQVAVIALFTTINCFGVTLGKLVQNTLSSIKLGGLLLLIAILLVHAHPGNLRFHLWLTSPYWELASFGVALVAVLWTYYGWHTISFVAGEVKNPSRNIPGSMILGILSCVTVYIFANIAYYSDLTPSAVSKSDRLAAVAISTAMGYLATVLLTILIRLPF